MILTARFLGTLGVALMLWLGAAGGLLAQGAEPRRVALVIGNARYVQVPALGNAVNDARLIADRLEGLGFEVMFRTDLTRRGFLDTMTEFRETVEGADTGLFFFAGHGVQLRGTNYLLPTDVEPGTTDFLNAEAIDLDTVTRILNEGAQVSMVFLDACRNNPFEATRGSDPDTRGLARVAAQRNTLISFAAAPGEVALDRVAGSDFQNSPFTTALARHLGTPGDPISRTMIKVRRDVLDLTDGRQVPWENSSLVEELVLTKDPAAPPEAVGALDAEFWDLIGESGSVDLLERFLERFPDSSFAPEAEARLRRARTARETAQAEPTEAELRAFYAEPLPPVILQRFWDCDTCPEMVEIEGSELIYGTPDTVARAQYDERPALRLSVGQAPIAVAVTETSQAQFDAFVRETGHDWPEACMITAGDDALPSMGSRSDVPQDPELPVTCVSWTDAKAYADWLSQKTGERYRLPNEIEHEYLAEALYFNVSLEERLDGRGVCEMVNIADYGAPFSWRNFGCEDALGRGAFPVRSLKPDGFGLYHLLGNVWEWAENCYTDHPQAMLPRSLILIEGAEECERRSVRGGGWSDPLTSLSTSNRNWEHPDFRSDTIGFRVLREM